MVRNIITPKTRKELWLNEIVGHGQTAPTNMLTREEFLFAEILGREVEKLIPMSRYEMYLAKIAGRNISVPYPKTREEFFLAKAAGMDIVTPYPMTREEIYWSNYSGTPEPGPQYTTIQGETPLVFRSDGNNMVDYAVYGNTGGVGDLNSTTGKYDIPVKIEGTNILVNTYQSEEYNGITITVNSDKSITLNGTAESSIILAVCNGSHSLTTPAYQIIDNGLYVISGSPSNQSEGTFMLSYRYDDAIGGTPSVLGRVPESGVIIDNRNGAYRYLAVYIAVWQGATLNNVTFYPMLRRLGIDGTYAPYVDGYTTTLSVDSPLTLSDSISKAGTGVEIPTINGINVLTLGTNVKPSNVMVKGNVEYISSGEPITYTVTYRSQDGTAILGTEIVEANKNAIGLQEEPTKESTAQYNYTFAGWSDTTNATTATSGVLNNITTDKTVYAAFSESTRTYTVYFYNESVLLQTAQNVPYGGSATYTGTEPTKTDYEFTGWNPQPTNIIADTSCYAQFEQRIQGLITDSWATISQRSSAGTAQNYYSVGDCKPVYLNGTMGTLALDTTLYVYILGFDHNSALEGTGITFGGFKTNYGDRGKNVALCDANYDSNNTSGLKWFNMNHRQGSSSSGHNYGGWKGCDMRYDILGSTDTAPSGYGATATTANVGYDATSTCATNPVANTLMSCLPSELRNVMKPVTKYTDNTGNESNVEANVTTSVDYLPLLSEYEVFGSRSYANQYEQNRQAQYAYYASGNSKFKYHHTTTSSSVHWWVRSPYYNNSYSFCYVRSGGAGNYGSRYSRGVAPCFLV